MRVCQRRIVLFSGETIDFLDMRHKRQDVRQLVERHKTKVESLVLLLREEFLVEDQQISLSN